MSEATTSASECTPPLLDRALGGDQQALGLVFESCRVYLTQAAAAELERVLRRKVNPSDLVQETFLVAKQNLPRFTGESLDELRAWLRGILANKLQETRRYYLKAKRRQIAREASLSGSKAELILGQISGPGGTGSWHVSLLEDVDLVAAGLEQLSADHQQVIRLRNWELHSFEEIGLQMNRTPGAARALWLRALEQLARSLESEHV